MGRIRRYLRALAVTVTASSCTPKPCDEERLAAAIGEAAKLSKAQYVERVAQACPKLPPILHESLKASTGAMPPDQRASLYARRADDAQWNTLSQQACPPADPPTAIPQDPDHARRLRCNIDRFGVLAPDDPFVSNDFEVFVLLAWLQAIRTDPTLATGVVAPLLAANASDAELTSMCEAGDGGCTTVLARLGLAPLLSTIDARPLGEDRLTITRGAVRMDSKTVLTLVDGHPREPGPVLASLRSALSPAPEMLSLLVDPQTPYRTFIDVGFTAAKADRRLVELLVLSGGRPRAIQLSWPRKWFPGLDDTHGDRLARLHVTVGAEHVRVQSPEIGLAEPPVALPCDPGTPCARKLSSLAGEYASEYPHDHAVFVDAHDDVPMQAVVHVLDALRGDRCLLSGVFAGDEAPRQCLQWQPILDAKPRLFFHVDRPGRFVIGEPYAEATGRTGQLDPRAAALVAVATEARTTIETCIADTPELLRALVGEREKIRVSYAPSSKDPSALVAELFVNGRVRPQAETCILEAMQATPSDYDNPMDLLAAQHFDVLLPLTLE